MEMRRRGPEARPGIRRVPESASGSSSSPSSRGRRDQSAFLTIYHWAALATLLGATGCLLRHLDYRFPPVRPADDPAEFSEERARAWLTELTSHGPRVSGSHTTEVIARQRILDSIAEVRKGASDAVAIAVDEQRPSGCFDLSFLHDFTLCYRQVLNIVVRIGPRQRSPTKHSLLISCHFDSVPDAPGATDDAVSCAIMLDVLRVLSRQTEPLPHDLILLFNGAEENFLQAAHGFISSHPWRHSIRAFINLEGSGAGGRELLFQAGPGNAWLIKTYMESAPHPHCSVMAQEVFQTGLIPSDTDYRIYRDYGRVPGLDIAYTRNGYVYHTEFDEVSRIQTGAIQRAGENDLAIVRGILASPYFLNPASYQEGRWVFFDVAGLFNLYYPVSTGALLNMAVCAGALAKVLWNFRAFRPRMVAEGPETGYEAVTFAAAVAVHLGVICVMAGVNLAMSRVVHYAGLTLVWYGHHGALFALYFFPPLLVGLKTHLLLSRLLFLRRDPWTMERVYWDATTAIYALITFAMTSLGLASAFLMLIHVLFPLCRPLLRRILPLRGGTGHLVASLLALFPVAFMGIYALLICFEFFIPMLGRSGTGGDPEFVMAFLCLIGPVSLSLYTGGWVFVSRSRVGKVGSWGLGLCTFLVLVMAVSDWGEPYDWHPQRPRLRRTAMLHIHREYRDHQGALLSKENALWMSSFDYRGTSDLPQELIEGAAAPKCSVARNEFCDLPYYVPVANMLIPRRSLWRPVEEEPVVSQRVEVKERARELDSKGQLLLRLSIGGPDHMTLYVTPESGWILASWSLSAQPFRLDQPPRTHVAFMAYAVQDSGPWDVSVSLGLRNGSSADAALAKGAAPVAAVAVAGHTLHGPHHKSPLLQRTEATIRQRRQQVRERDPPWPRERRPWPRWLSPATPSKAPTTRAPSSSAQRPPSARGASRSERGIRPGQGSGARGRGGCRRPHPQRPPPQEPPPPAHRGHHPPEAPAGQREGSALAKGAAPVAAVAVAGHTLKGPHHKSPLLQRTEATIRQRRQQVRERDPPWPRERRPWPRWLSPATPSKAPTTRAPSSSAPRPPSARGASRRTRSGGGSLRAAGTSISSPSSSRNFPSPTPA